MSPARAKSAAGRPVKVWVPAAKSEIYRSVRAWIADEGHDPKLFDSLCFGIGAMPSLLAHGQVFSHVAELLDAPVFANSANWSPSAWPRLLPHWQAMLRSWPAVCSRANSSGYSSLLAVPKSKPPGKTATPKATNPRHPMDGQGITNVPVAAALWCTVHSKPSGPQTQELAHRFNLLQSMFFSLVLEMRWRSGATVDDYLHFEPQPNRVEFAPIPISAAAAGRAIRWLSAPKQVPLLLDLPDDPQPQAFTQGMRSWAERLSQDTKSSATRGSTAIQDAEQAYPMALANFFEHWDELLDASYTPQRRTRSSSAQSKEGEGRPVNPSAEVTEPGAFSESAAHGQARPGHSNLGGLAPSDAKPRELQLAYDHADHLRRTSRQKWQQMREATRMVNLPWALEHYTPKQIKALAEAVKECIHSDRPAAARQGALLTLLCAATGRDPADLLDIRLFALDSRAHRAIPHPPAVARQLIDGFHPLNTPPLVPRSVEMDVNQAAVQQRPFGALGFCPDSRMQGEDERHLTSPAAVNGGELGHAQPEVLCCVPRVSRLSLGQTGRSGELAARRGIAAHVRGRAPSAPKRVA